MAIGTPVGSEFQPVSPYTVTTRACAVPTGTSDGDILVAYCVLSQDDNTATGFTVNSGTWAQTTFARTTQIGLTGVLIKQWNTGDPTTYTFGKSGSSLSGTFGVVMVRVPGAKATPNVAPTATNQTAQSTSITCPAVTVPSGLPSNALVISFYHVYYSLTAKAATDTMTPRSGHTEMCDQSDDWVSMGACTLSSGAATVAASAATGTSSTSGAWGRGVTLVMEPSVTATPTKFFVAY